MCPHYEYAESSLGRGRIEGSNTRRRYWRETRRASGLIHAVAGT